LFVVERDQRVSIRKPNRYDEAMLVGDMTDEVDLAAHAQSIEHRPQGVDSFASLQASDVS